MIGSKAKEVCGRCGHAVAYHRSSEPHQGRCKVQDCACKRPILTFYLDGVPGDSGHWNNTYVEKLIAAEKEAKASEEMLVAEKKKARALAEEVERLRDENVRLKRFYLKHRPLFEASKDSDNEDVRNIVLFPDEIEEASPSFDESDIRKIDY